MTECNNVEKKDWKAGQSMRTGEPIDEIRSEGGADKQKNKRRCDGFAPCSNCEFSSRACLYINAQGEVIPPPRTRESVVKKDVPADGTPNGMSGSMNGDPANGDNSGTSPGKRADGGDAPNPHERKTPRKDGDKAEKETRGYVDGLEAVDRDIAFSAELLDSKCHCQHLPLVRAAPTI